MKQRVWLISLILSGVLIGGAACGDAGKKANPPSPTVPSSPTVILAAPTQTPGGPTLTPSSTVPPTVTPIDTPLPPPPTEPPTATPTPGPFEHVIQAGDDCIGIAYQYGHNSLDVLGLIESLNSIRCSALPLGQAILVPRPTSTPTPVGADLTQTAIATSAPPMVVIGPATLVSVQPYTVKDGDTLSSIAILSDSSLRQLCELNAGPGGIDCRGCTWESPHCCCPYPPVLSVGQQINVPAPTPTPTYTPTLSGSETPTATPTYRPPQPVYPPNGANVAGAVRLSWLTVGVLGEDEYYLVVLHDETTGAMISIQTRQLSADVPPEYLPTDGQARTFAWQVTVTRLGADGLLYPLGSAVGEQRFTWRGWE